MSGGGEWEVDEIVSVVALRADGDEVTVELASENGTAVVFLVVPASEAKPYHLGRKFRNRVTRYVSPKEEG